MGAATWHVIRDYLEDPRQTWHEAVEAHELEALGQMAREYQRIAPEIEGQMPFIVEMFIARFGSADSGGA
jgi:hypothetical protein